MLGGSAMKTIPNSTVPLAVGTASVQALLVPVMAICRAEMSIEGMSGYAPTPGMPRSLL